MLSDNRDLSLDSRYWGFVPQALILGRVEVVRWSSDKDHNPRLERVGIMPR